MTLTIGVSRQVLVLGGTPEAGAVSEELAKLGYAVQWVSPDGATAAYDTSSLPPGVCASPGASVTAFEGQAGDFRATLVQGGQVRQLGLQAVVVANGNERYYPEARYGLPLSPNVLTAPQLEARMADTAGGNGAPQCMAFLLDYGGQAAKETATEVLQMALCARQAHCAEVYVFYENLQVDSPGLERLTRQMRDAGIVFSRYAQVGISVEDDGVALSYAEGVVQAALLVLPEAVRPHAQTVELASVLDVRLGADGFFQDINIRQYRPGLSSRRGVFFAGRCHMDGSVEEAKADALQTAANVDALLGGGEVSREPIVAEVDSSKCVRCLTCVRTCPHAAVEIAEYEQVIAARVMALACYGCGACVVNCPVRAIELVGDASELVPVPAWLSA